MSIYVIGVDPGSTGDRTGISIVRRDRAATHLQTVTAMRGIKMSEIAQAVLALVRRLDGSLPKADRIAVVIDRGGIGLGPAEEIERSLKVAKKDGTLSRRVAFRAVHVVGGDGITPDPKDPSRVSVGRDLLYERGLQALREKTLIVANADGDAVKMLQDELDGLVVTYSGTRRTGRTDHGKGKNDDVVFSLLLAYWLAAQTGFGGHTSVGGTVKAMARTLTSAIRPRSTEQQAPARPSIAKPKTLAAKVWSHADLIAEIRRESLLIPGAVNMTHAQLLDAVNAVLIASGRSALAGTVEVATKPAGAPDASWRAHLG